MHDATAPGKAPFFSVMVPTYNQAGYLDACLTSLVAQNDPDWEAVVVDDGSTDDTPQVLAAWRFKEPRLRVIRQENGGTAAALNTALAACRGSWVCWLSSDDLFEPDKLALHRRAVADQPDIRFFHTHFYQYEEDTGFKTAPNHWRPIPEPGLQVARFLSGNYVCGITVCVQRQALVEAGPWRADLRHGQDFALWLELSRRHRSSFLDRRTAIVRCHAGQTTNAFPVAGFYDSAWACLDLLNAVDLPGLFPALDLDDPDQARAAATEVLAIGRDPGAFLHQLGYSPALLDRFVEWAHDPADGRARALCRDLLTEAAADPGLAGSPEPIRDLFARAAGAVGPRPYVPVAVLDFIRSVIVDPRTDAGKRRNLIRYLDRKNGPWRRP